MAIGYVHWPMANFPARRYLWLPPAGLGWAAAKPAAELAISQAELFPGQPQPRGRLGLKAGWKPA
jgi:hypothetical protein